MLVIIKWDGYYKNLSLIVVIIVLPTENSKTYERNVDCQSPVSQSEPHFEADCPNIRDRRTKVIGHRFRYDEY